MTLKDCGDLSMDGLFYVDYNKREISYCINNVRNMTISLLVEKGE